MAAGELTVVETKAWWNGVMAATLMEAFTG